MLQQRARRWSWQPRGQPQTVVERPLDLLLLRASLRFPALHCAERLFSLSLPRFTVKKPPPSSVVARAEAAAATAVCAAAWTPPERETASPAHRTQPQPLLTPRALEAALRTAKAAYEKTEKSICETDMRNL